MEGPVLNPSQWVEGEVGVHPCFDAATGLVLWSVTDPPGLLHLPVCLPPGCLSLICSSLSHSTKGTGLGCALPWCRWTLGRGASFDLCSWAELEPLSRHSRLATKPRACLPRMSRVLRAESGR